MKFEKYDFNRKKNNQWVLPQMIWLFTLHVSGHNGNASSNHVRDNFKSLIKDVFNLIRKNLVYYDFSIKIIKIITIMLE